MTVSPRCRARQLTTLQANQRPRLPRYIGAALLATLASAASAYLLLPSAPSRAAPTLAREPLSVDYFTPSVVLESKDATPDTKIITLRVDPTLIPPRLVPSTNETDSEERTHRPIYSVFVKDSDIQVERPYTPLECADEEGKMHFWIKKYEKGEVGRWLHARKVGDTVELRGPELSWDWSWRQDDWDEVVMVGRTLAAA
jgi:cytochrome-b5 reductase